MRRWRLRSEDWSASARERLELWWDTFVRWADAPAFFGTVALAFAVVVVLVLVQGSPGSPTGADPAPMPAPTVRGTLVVPTDATAPEVGPSVADQDGP